MSEAAPVLLEEDRGAVRVLRLNRPEKRNALTPELGCALVRAAERAAADDTVRVVGLTGSGGAFCAGADLAPGDGAAADSSGRSPQAAALDDVDWIGRFLLSIRLVCEKPVVAGIDGVAIGAGTALALCADLRVASERAALHPCSPGQE